MLVEHIQSNVSTLYTAPVKPAMHLDVRDWSALRVVLRNNLSAQIFSNAARAPKPRSERAESKNKKALG